MKKKLNILAIIMVVIVLVVFITSLYISRNNKEATDIEDDKIRVVTSFYPTYILTTNLTDGISDIRVDSLTDFSAGCLHDYQLTTNDMRLLSNAHVFIINGGGMEEYLEEVVDSFPELEVIDLSKGIVFLESEVHEGGDNPHVWLDPELYMIQIENAREGLETFIRNKGNIKDNINNDGKDESGYNEYNKEITDYLNANASAYLDDVAVLADDMNLMLNTVNDMVQHNNISNKVVVFHDSFAYLSTKAGLEVAYTVEVDEDHPLSAGEIAEIIDAIRDENISYLFTEEQYDDSISDRIKDETDAEVYIIDSAVTGDVAKDSYIKAMRRNIETLKKAFEG